jgi:organic hydroperoxide reductase OsmC/OhrA
MEPYPHTYSVSALTRSAGNVMLSSPQLPDLPSAAPAQFGGPGDLWSPETLLCASLADCFVLTFRAVARAARFEWRSLECRVLGTLESPERISQFTRFTTIARLAVPGGASIDKARDLLERAEHGCLIANSVRGTRVLQVEIVEEPAGIVIPA